MTMFEAEHLGGYRIGGDDATYYPALWQWLIDSCHVRTMLDVGCGEGHALRYFREQRCFVRGVDGVPQEDPDIVTFDFTSGAPTTFELGLLHPVQLVWSCEFVEHVEERFVPNFLDVFRHGSMVLLTHAEPGQGGYHHVNCRTSDYWVGAMAAIGYALDQGLTVTTRELAAANHSPWNHYVRSGLAFVRQD
jgi:hypothetical protein